MTLPITPELLRASYNFLRATPPFKRWDMPPGEDVKFNVTRSVWTRGDHEIRKGTHIIGVSSVNTGCTDALLRVMAHEMVHASLGDSCGKSVHGAAFHKRARSVCRYHSFDQKMF